MPETRNYQKLKTTLQIIALVVAIVGFTGGILGTAYLKPMEKDIVLLKAAIIEQRALNEARGEIFARKDIVDTRLEAIEADIKELKNDMKILLRRTE